MLPRHPGFPFYNPGNFDFTENFHGPGDFDFAGNFHRPGNFEFTGNFDFAGNFHRGRRRRRGRGAAARGQENGQQCDGRNRQPQSRARRVFGLSVHALSSSGVFGLPGFRRQQRGWLRRCFAL